jgi:hypothetical protein
MVTLFRADCGERRNPTGIVAGAGSDHSRTKDGQIRQEPASPACWWPKTTTAPSQQASTGSYYRCS